MEELLFTVAFKSLDDKFKDITSTTVGRIYKITNNMDNKMYIGSTTISLEERFKFHKSASDCKLHKHIVNIKGEMSIELIKEVNAKTCEELLLHEDYYIFKNDTVEKGLNLKYNTEIGKIIISNESGDMTARISSIARCVDEYYMKYINSNRISEKMNVSTVINNLGDIILDPAMFSKYNEDFGIYYAGFLLNKSLTICETKVESNYESKQYDMDIYGFYLAKWENNKTYIFCRAGGLKNLLTSKVQIYTNKFIKLIQQNGSNFVIYPLCYFKNRNREREDYSVNIFMKGLEKEIKNYYKIYKPEVCENINMLRFIFKMKLDNDKVNMEDRMSTYIEYCTTLKQMSKQQMEDSMRKYKQTVKLFDIEKRKRNLAKVVKDIKPNENKLGELIKTAEITNKSEDGEKNINKKVNYDSYEFNSKTGRPTKYKSAEEKRKAQLESKRKWREENRNRINAYNKYYKDKVKVQDI